MYPIILILDERLDGHDSCITTTISASHAAVTPHLSVFRPSTELYTGVYGQVNILPAALAGLTVTFTWMTETV
jgi:hypothetical protein